MRSDPEVVHTAQTVAIGRGAHGTVELDRATMTVHKRLHRRDEAAAEDLRREFDHLHRFSLALEAYPFLGCPVPLDLDYLHRTLLMTFCPGTPVDQLLSQDDNELADHLEHVGDQIRTAVEVYVATFGRPFFSLSPANMIYEPKTRTLHLYDFTKARAFPGIDLHRHPIEVSLGCFVARIMQQTHGPLTFWHRARRARSKVLIQAVVEPLITQHDLDTAVILQVARAVRRALVRRTPLDRRPLVWAGRFLWYRAIANHLVERQVRALLALVTTRLTAGPAPLTSRRHNASRFGRAPRTDHDLSV